MQNKKITYWCLMFPRMNKILSTNCWNSNIFFKQRVIVSIAIAWKSEFLDYLLTDIILTLAYNRQFSKWTSLLVFSIKVLVFLILWLLPLALGLCMLHFCNIENLLKVQIFDLFLDLRSSPCLVDNKIFP